MGWFNYATPYWAVTILLGCVLLAVIARFPETHRARSVPPRVGSVSQFVAYVAVPIVIANVWLVDALSRWAPPRTMVLFSALAMGVLMALIIVPDSKVSLWFTLGPTALALAVCLPSCAAMLSLAADDREQGRAMGNNQSMQVGAESLSGPAGGALAAIAVKLPLLACSGAALAGSATLGGLRRRRLAAQPDPAVRSEALR